MRLHIVPARTGVTWVKLGFKTFLQQPLAMSGLLLREGDVITMGTTELMVHVTDLEDLENFPPEIAA